MDLFYIDDPHVLARAIFLAVITLILKWWNSRGDESHPRTIQRVHAATEDDVRRLRSSGQTAAGTVYDLMDRRRYEVPKGRSLRVAASVEVLFTLVAGEFVREVSKLFESRSNDESVVDEPIVVLNGNVQQQARYLLYEFEIQHAGQLTKFRGAQRFDQKIYLAIQQVGKTVTVSYLPEDPSVSVAVLPTRE